MYREQKKGKNVPPKSGQETGNGRADKYSADGSKGKNIPPKSGRETETAVLTGLCEER